TDNTAMGFNSLYSNTIGIENTATGSLALKLSTGPYNTATGSQALANNTTGALNTAIGRAAMVRSYTGDQNTAVGSAALADNGAGSFNTGLGSSALQGAAGNYNTSLGYAALYGMAGNYNIGIGVSSGSGLGTGNNNIYIDSLAHYNESNVIRIGGDTGNGYGSQTQTFIAGINGVDKSSGNPVFIDANGQLGTGSTANLIGPTG